MEQWQSCKRRRKLKNYESDDNEDTEMMPEELEECL
jgi:hypothetical protein